MQKLQGMRREVEEKVVGVLTAEQQKGFEELKGKPFEFPQGGGFGGGRPGGNRPGGAPGGERPARPNRPGGERPADPNP
jgi:hypothetical protein